LNADNANADDAVEAETATLVYDGECPFCQRYTRLVRLRETIDVQLIDARVGGAEVDAIVAAGYNLDEGMVLEMGGRFYHGDACVHRLALLSSSSSLFNRLNKWMFSSPRAAKVLYPMLRFCRNVVLRLLGRKPLDLSG